MIFFGLDFNNLRRTTYVSTILTCNRNPVDKTQPCRAAERHPTFFGGLWWASVDTAILRRALQRACLSTDSILLWIDSHPGLRTQEKTAGNFCQMSCMQAERGNGRLLPGQGRKATGARCPFLPRIASFVVYGLSASWFLCYLCTLTGDEPRAFAAACTSTNLIFHRRRSGGQSAYGCCIITSPPCCYARISRALCRTGQSRRCSRSQRSPKEAAA